MRLFLAAIAAPLLVSLIACADDPPQPTPECMAPAAGAIVTDAATCHEPPAGDTAAVDAFRSHTIRASSAAGGATRVAQGVVNGVADCFGQIIVSSVGSAIATELTGQETDLPVDCSNEIEAKGFASFANGTYTLKGQERGGKIGDFVVDSAASSTLRLYFAHDIGNAGSPPSFHQGDLVTADALAIDSYLVNAHLVVDAQGNALVGYDRPGPLVEILGKGKNPPNPLAVTDDVKTSVSSAYAVEGSVHTDVSDCGGGYHTVADHDIPRTPLSQDIKPTLVSAVTTGPHGQTITAKTWDATYTLANGGSPTGSVTAEVAGVDGVAHARVDFDDPAGEGGTLTLICQ